MSQPLSTMGPRLGETFNRFSLTDRVLPRILETYAGRYGDGTFASLPGGSMTFADAPRLAARTAGALESLCLKAEENVAVLLGNRIEFIATVWAQGWRGGICVPMHSALTGAQLLHVFQRTKPAALVVDAARLPAVAAVAAELTHLRHVIVVGGDGTRAWPGPAFHVWGDLLDAADPAAPSNVAFSAPMIIMFTSGTTGLPKGVVVSHHHYYCYAAPNVDNQNWGPGSHLYTPMPLCHAAAHFNLLVPGFMAGARVTIAEGFSASRFWEEVATRRATHVTLPGVATNILMRQPPCAADREHSVRTIGCAPPPINVAAFEQRFGVRVLWQSYGQTEGNYNPRVLEQADKPRNCIGRPLPLFQLTVLDENDAALPHDGIAVGEIAVRPLQPFAMTTQYYRDPDATLAAFRNQWFHTGDLGSIDAENFVYLRGRKKDSIRRRGENVSALDIEQAALAHPDIQQAAAFAVPAELGEDDIKLDVVLIENSTTSAEDIARFLESRLAVFMRPRYVQLRASFPMTPSQRVEKYRLQQEGVGGAQYVAVDQRASRERRSP